jgi:hypothetical protein
MNDEEYPPEWHTAAILEAYKEGRPFSLLYWFPLFGRTVNWDQDTLPLTNESD